MRTSSCVLALILLGACSAAASPSVSTDSATPSVSIAPAPPGMIPMHDGTLHPGATYATAAFGLRFALSVSPKTKVRWFASETSLVRQLEIGDPGLEGEGVQFYLPSAGYDLYGFETAVPKDFVAWLTSSPQLAVLKKQSTTVGGRPAVAVTVRVRQLLGSECGCIKVASTKPDAPFRPLVILASAASWTIVVVNTRAGQMLISEESGATFTAVQALVATLQFLP
jgi:hypothetical protein